MKKILTVIGTRPQFIKASAVSRVFAYRDDVQEVIVHSGQHYENSMSDVFFDNLEIPRPDYFLNVHGGSHGDMTGRMMIELEPVIIEESPDIVVVYGDSNSTLAGALTAVKLTVPVAHVEAGLRSRNLCMPEEINRVLTDRISQVLLCPTAQAVKNLESEGFGIIYDCEIVLSGDVMYDASKYYAERSAEASMVMNMLEQRLPGGSHSTFALCTVHRAENTDNPQRLAAVMDALYDVAHEIPVVFPMHPRTQRRLIEHGIDVAHCLPDLIIIDPVGYLDMIELLKRCCIVLTDSGGLQKESCYFGKPCIVLRRETEWVELIEAGICRLMTGDNIVWKDMLPVQCDVLSSGLFREGAANTVCSAIIEYVN